MSVKKIMLVAGTALVSASALAGGPDKMMAPQAVKESGRVYVDVNAGYVVSDWRNLTPDSSGTNPFAAGQGNRNGFDYGVDVGYEFTKNIAAEVGMYGLPNVSGTAGTSTAVGTGNLQIKSWFAYLAGKLTVPVVDAVEIFGKVGAAYRGLNFSGAGAGVPGANNGYWNPVFGVGAQYVIDNNWSVNVQYLYMAGFTTSEATNRHAPSISSYTVGLGYNFAV